LSLSAILLTSITISTYTRSSNPGGTAVPLVRVDAEHTGRWAIDLEAYKACYCGVRG